MCFETQICSYGNLLEASLLLEYEFYKYFVAEVLTLCTLLVKNHISKVMESFQK